MKIKLNNFAYTPMHKSNTCFTKDNTPRSEYDNEWEARESAIYTEATKGITLFPYHCRVCGKWHLSPIRYDYSCGCQDSEGKPKNLYPSEKQALEVARTQGCGLITYPCPYGDGFHLTKGW